MAKLQTVGVDDLILQVVEGADSDVTVAQFQEAIDAKEATLNAALRRCVQKGRLVRTGRGRFAEPDPSVAALLAEAGNAGIDAQMHGGDRVSIPLETLRSMLEG